MNHSRAMRLACVAIVALSGTRALALPTMIRLGYTDCSSCHYAPEGGGPLNPYGRGIDEGQSLRAGEYQARDNSLVRALSWKGRIAQDLRLVVPVQRAWAAHDASASFRPRLLYRNVTELSRRVAVHVSVAGELDPAPRTGVPYDPGPRPASPAVNVAALRYRVSRAVELSAGRDQLPGGINIPDAGAFIRQRNRLGFHEAPTQLKLRWAGTRHRVVPFAYVPAANEATGDRESGAGTLVELDPFGTRRAVIGVNVLRGGSRNGTRRLLGAHARIGFGSWGILAEHDISDREREDVPAPFRQHASYGQAFWAVREWLVASAIAERLAVQRPFEERLAAARLEFAARLTSVASISAGAGIQRDALTGRTSRTLMFQIALKTVY